MAQVLVIYNAPTDPAAFQTHYHQTHTPLVKKIPGLRSFALSDGPIQALAGSAPYFIALLTFDSMAELQAGMASPEGQAAADDLPNFGTGGATILIFDSKVV